MPDINQVRQFLSQHGVSVLEFEEETPTANTAARAVGCSAAEIAKSILMLISGEPVLIVTSGDMKVNSSMLKKATGRSGKVRLPSAEDVINFTGYAPGGVCPFLLPESLPIFLDASLKRFATIYPAAGNNHSAVPISYKTLKSLVTAAEAEMCLPFADGC